MKITCLLLFFLAFSLSSYSQRGEFTDDRDGKTYKTIAIEGQVWMAENLKYLPEFGNYCTYDNDAKNLVKYGYLYDWETSMSVCPSGWHLPTGEELSILIKNLGGKGYPAYKALTSKKDPGFAAPLAGWRILWGTTFVDLGFCAGFWSSTMDSNSDQNEKEAWRIVIRGGGNINKEAGLISSDIRNGLSVRCLKD